MMRAFLCLLLIYLASAKVERKRYLDYLDAETMEYYLEAPRLDHDVVVLFYASWDRNSHALAPIYGQIAKLLDAGSEDSHLILGLFDCEASTANSKVCNTAGITHYPTILYFSLSGQHLQARKPKHASKFPGNWQYGDAVLDWLKTMRGLSSWHRKGLGQRLRSMLFGQKTEKHQLPIGKPASATGAMSNSTELEQLQKEKKQLGDLVLRSSVMVESVLYPMTDPSAPTSTLLVEEHRNYTDLYALLAERWTSGADEDVILRTCVGELTLDYCERYATLASTGYLGIDVHSPTLAADLAGLLTQEEPYCLLIEKCVVDQFVDDKCRPAQCPLGDKAGCRYLTSCLFASMQEDYRKALGLTKNTTTMPEAPKKKSWGFL